MLTACRAWRYLEDDVLGSKVESGRRARAPADHRRLPDPGPLVDAALAAQRGLAPMPQAAADLAAADRFVAAVLDRFAEAQR